MTHRLRKLNDLTKSGGSERNRKPEDHFFWINATFRAGLVVSSAGEYQICKGRQILVSGMIVPLPMAAPVVDESPTVI